MEATNKPPLSLPIAWLICLGVSLLATPALLILLWLLTAPSLLGFMVLPFMSVPVAFLQWKALDPKEGLRAWLIWHLALVILSLSLGGVSGLLGWQVSPTSGSLADLTYVYLALGCGVMVGSGTYLVGLALGLRWILLPPPTR